MQPLLEEYNTLNSEYKHFDIVLDGVRHVYDELLGKKHGELQLYDVNGKLLMTQMWFNGLKHGDNKWYVCGTVTVHRQFKNDKLHGFYREWNYFGKPLLDCHYVNGKRHGEYKIYREVITITMYVMGVRQGECKKLYLSNNLLCKMTYANDERQGEATAYHENGDLMYSFKFVNDKVSGDVIEYYSNAFYRVGYRWLKSLVNKGNIRKKVKSISNSLPWMFH